MGEEYRAVVDEAVKREKGEMTRKISKIQSSGSVRMKKLATRRAALADRYYMVL